MGTSRSPRKANRNKACDTPAPGDTRALLRRIAELEAEISRGAAERRRMQEELQERQAMLSAAFDNAPFEFWARDINGVCVLENAPLVKHWGSILGKKPEDSDVPKESLAVWKANNRRAYAGEVVQGEVEYVVNGIRRVFYNVVAPIRVDNVIQGILGFNIDITERKEAEALLRQSQADEEIIKATHREQSRIGRDLHDGVCQILVAAQLIAQALHRRLNMRSLPEAAEAKYLQGIIKEAVSQARSVTHELIPTELETGGITLALRDLAARSMLLYRIPCSFTCVRQPELNDTDTAVHLFRIAQEAVYNAARHAKPGRISIGLAKRDRRIILTISDDGRGLPRKPRKHAGFGIQIMRHRARLIGGRLTVEAGPSGGTVVTCICPAGKPTR